MLKILFPFIMILLIPLLFPKTDKTWYKTMNSLILLSFFLLLLIPTKIHTFNFISSFSYIDTMSFSMVLLTSWISALMILASAQIKKSPNKTSFLMMTLLLNLILILSFFTNNYILFYFYFEASLVPTLTLILCWGYQPERLQAGNYLMLYTVTASLPLLTSLLILQKTNKSASMMMLLAPPLIITFTSLWWTFSILAFLVKMPMFIFHLWLPKAHVEAPVAGSMILAGVLLKLGSYGLLRLSSPFMKMNLPLIPLISSISMWGAVITSMICLRQPDIKSLIAYSSVGHMGLVTAGILSSNTWGYEGALLMSLAHGLCSSALFAMANMMYEGTNTRSIFLTKGFLSIYPAMTFWWFIATSANMAAPPTLNLTSEIMLLTSILSSSFSFMIPIMLASFLAAAYSLYLYTSTQHGAPPMFKSPLSLMAPRNYHIIFLHMAPLFIMITKPTMFALWI